MAARLVDHVLPDVRLRQWVLSVPFELRIVLAKNPAALTACGRIFVEEIFRWQRLVGMWRGWFRRRTHIENCAGALSVSQSTSASEPGAY